MLEHPIYERMLDDANIGNQVNDPIEQADRHSEYFLGNTPLHLATFFADKNLALVEIQKLIKSGASVQARNQFGQTPLHFAVLKRQHRLVETLLDAEANPNDQDDYGHTALHFAINNHAPISRMSHCPRSCDHSHADKWIVKKLIEYKVDVDLLNGNKESALMWAIMEEDLDVVKELLKSGASTNQRSISDRTSALNIALSKLQPYIVIVNELLQRGGEFDLVNEEGHKPLGIDLNAYNLSPKILIAKLLIKLEIWQEFDKHEFATYRLKPCELFEYPELSDFYSNCCDEMDRMKKDRVKGNYSVHDFAMRGHHKMFYSWDAREKAYNYVFTKLKRGKFPIYYDLLLNQFERRYLENLFCKTGVHAERESDQEEIFLNYDVLHVVSSNLSNMDMYNFIPEYPQETKLLEWFSNLLSSLLYVFNGAFSFFTNLIFKG